MGGPLAASRVQRAPGDAMQSRLCEGLLRREGALAACWTPWASCVTKAQPLSPLGSERNSYAPD